MTLPASGTISLSQVNTELGKALNTQISLNQADVRTLFGISSGAIAMSNGHGKSQSVLTINLTVSAHAAYYNIRTAAINAGWNGTSPVQINLTVNSGIYVYSDNVASPSIQTGTPYPAGSTINLINNAFIIGKGGKGQHAGVHGAEAGGPALYLNYPITITNNGYIAGGGGGGGCGHYANPGFPTYYGGGGGGAGGGAGGGGWVSSQGAIYWGGAGGGLGANGGNTVTDLNSPYFGGVFGGGGGGRILPGSGGGGCQVGSGAGIVYGGGAGGGGGCAIGLNAYGWLINGPAGGGGGWGAAGGAGDSSSTSVSVAGNGGSANNIGGATGNNGYSGAAGGKAIVTNGHAVTWIKTGNVYGIVG